MIAKHFVFYLHHNYAKHISTEGTIEWGICDFSAWYGNIDKFHAIFTETTILDWRSNDS